MENGRLSVVCCNERRSISSILDSFFPKRIGGKDGGFNLCQEKDSNETGEEETKTEKGVRDTKETRKVINEGRKGT